MTGSIFPGGVRPDGLPAALSDPRRIAAVLATGLLNTKPEPPFDDLAEIAAGKASAISWSDWATGSWSRTLPRTRAPVITPLSRQ
jgi:hypothetical protein